jgi:DNA-binding GntR family transcriptional regulator
MVPVDPISVVDQVTVQIRHSIVTGELPAGKSFSITNLAEQLGVSHIPVREALRRLETEGLVTLRPTRGGEVRPMNKDDVNGIYRLRLLFEPDLAARGVALLTEDDISNLKSILDETSLMMSVDERMDMHRRFHLGLAQKAMSDWDLRVWDYLFTANERYARLLFALQDESGHDDDHHEVHERLLKAAASRSDALVRAVTTEHLTRNQERILSMLDESNRIAGKR